jgi:hypothetical protein
METIQATPDRPTKREWLRAHAPLVLLGVAVLLAYALVVPRMGSEGVVRGGTLELDRGQPVPELKRSASTARNIYGFVVAPFDKAKVSFALPKTFPVEGDKTTLTITAGGGPGVSTRVTLIDASGARHLLGRPERWLGHTVDASSLVGSDGSRLEITATNSQNEPRLVADRLVVLSYPPAAIPKASRWEVTALIVLALLFVLVLLNRARRDAPLIAAAGILTFIVWPKIVAAAFVPLSDPGLWDAATGAKWLDIDQGLLSGTFGGLSHLAVQLLHAMSFVTGTGATGARVASMVVGLAALAAIYYLGLRVAGRVGAVAASVCALFADSFRASLVDGTSTTTLVLAACLFLVAAHRVLQRGDRGSLVVLGAAGAIAILAEPLWWPGVVATIVLLAVRHAPHAGGRRAALIAGLVALVVISLPARISVAHQQNDLNGDVVERLTGARNAEFVGRGHGAPPTAAALEANPRGGPQVGMLDYLFGDHGLDGTVEGTVGGAFDSVSAIGERPQTEVFGLLAFLLEIAGVLVLILVPRLRMLVLAAALLSLVPWFLADHGLSGAFASGAAIFPALLLGGATIAHMAYKAARERYAGTELPGAGSLLPAVRRRARLSKPG